MIEVLNSRYVCFYFCFRKGIGYDDDAAKFYNPLLAEDIEFRNGIPPVMIFSPGGEEVLAKIRYGRHTNKDTFYADLVKVLRDHSEFNEFDEEEKAVIAQASHSGDSESLFRAGRVQERIGAYEEARTAFASAAESSDRWGALALLALARIARHERQWDAAESALEKLEVDKAAQRFDLAADVAAETGRRLVAAKKYEKARTILDDAILANPDSSRLAEMHFYAGAACFALGSRDWAHFHWWWVIKNRPNDPHNTRSFVALAAEVFPFDNPELDGFHGGGTMTIEAADRERERTLADYERLAKVYGR